VSPFVIYAADDALMVDQGLYWDLDRLRRIPYIDVFVSAGKGMF
jgi:hypothetical protein